jgi:hypothetical protein
MFRAANTPDKSNNLLLPGFQTQLLKVIKYYCSGSSTPGSLILLEPMRKHRKQSQAHSRKHRQRDSLKHTINAQAHTNHDQCTGSTGHGVLPGSQLKK